MHKVYYSKVLGTMVQVDAEDGWATAYTANGYQYGKFADIYLRKNGFVFTGNGTLGREAIAAAPEVIREAFLPGLREALNKANRDLAEASMIQNDAELRVKRFENMGVDSSNQS